MVIGITGSFGSGKTSVAKMFGRLGAHVIDADKVCYGLMAPSRKVYKRIIRHFGKSILKKDNTIDRKKLAKIVFKNQTKLRLLNRLVHPEAIRQIERIIRANKKQGIIVIDAALLVESGFYKKIDYLIVVRTKRVKQTNRIVRTKDMTREQVLDRIRMQTPLKRKQALADFIIDNSGSKEQTRIQVEKIWSTLSEDITY